MPSREQMERAIREIEALSEEYSFRRIDDGRVAPASHGRGTEDGFSFWGELTDAQKRDALARGVDWEGFSEAQEQDVIRRVLDGQDAEFWMDGIGPVGPGIDQGEAARRGRLTGRIIEAISVVDWDSMTRVERAAWLEHAVDWDEFDAAERFDAIENVLAGKGRARWLEGIESRAGRDAREDATWAEAARHGNGSPNSEPYFRRDRIAHAVETIGELKDTEDFVLLGDFRVVSESAEEPDGASVRLGGWDRLHEWDKLGVILSGDATDGLGPDDKKALLGRHIDFSRVPEDVQRRWLGEVYHDAPAKGTTTAEAHERRERDGAVERLVADFRARIGGLIREGVPDFPPLGHTLPWEQATEGRKLANIVWESMSLHPLAGRPGVIALPGAVALEAVERHVDYAGLPEVQRELLTELRSRLDAGQFAGPPPGHKDPVADGLGRAVGIVDLEEMLAAWKQDGDRPWAARPEAEKVRVIVDHALETAVPGAYTVAVIGREVDDAGLPPWRRAALEGLRARIDGGEFDGVGRGLLDPDDRLDRALRLAELEARVEDYKHLGDDDPDPGRYRRWDNMLEDVKLHFIVGEIRELHLSTEPKAYEVVPGEVDLARVPEEMRREFEETRREARTAPDVGPQREQTPLERVERELRDWKTYVPAAWEGGVSEADKLRMLVREMDWTGVSPEDKAGLLAREVALDRVAEEDRRQFLGEAARDGREIGGAAAATPGRGEYQVWHIADDRQALLTSLGVMLPVFPEAYTRVATVQADSLDRAFALTNHGDNAWQENPGVVGTEARSTSVGDVIVDPQGRPHRVENAGFKELPVPDESPLERVERQLRELKQEPEIYLESTRHYVQPDPEDPGSVYDTCDVFGPWDTLKEAEKLRVLTAEFDWSGVSPEDKHRLLAREVSLDRVPEEDRRQFLGEAAREGRDTGVTAAGPPGNGEYQVWHDRGWPQSRLDQMLGGAPPSRFPEDYFHAADVQAGSLEEAVRLTTSEGHVLEGDHRPWDDNRGVRSYTPRPFVPRDTDAGDVIVDPLGKAYRYDGRGFAAIETAAEPPFPPSAADRERQAIAAYDAVVAEMTRGGSEEPSGLARAWQAGSERERLGLLAQLALDHGVDEEVFVRRALRVMGWREPTAAQREAMADAWAYAEGVGVPSPEALRELHAEWRRDGARRAMPDVRADVFDGLMARLEGFGDELARLAGNEEQKALAQAFGELVGDVDSSIRSIAEATRQYGPPRAGVALHPPGEEPVRLPSPGDIAAGHDGTAGAPAPGRGEDQGRPFRDYARAVLDRFRGAAGRIFAREVLPPPSPGDIAERGGPSPAPEPGRGKGRGR